MASLGPRLGEGIHVETVTPARLDKLATLFGSSKTTAGCYCMWYVVSAKECEAGWRGGNRDAFESMVRAAAEPVGLIAFAGDRPVGWCAAGPRDRYARALRSITLKAREPTEDSDVWLVPCFFVHRDARRMGITRTLLESAITLAQQHGAAAIEGFPLAGNGRRSASAAYLGVEPLFSSCGFTVIARPSAGRVVMRRELTPSPSSAQP